jgi:hypothetical protein
VRTTLKVTLMPSEQLKTLVDQMPDADSRGMYTENIDKEKIERAAAEIAKRGQENLLGLIEMLSDPGSAADVKPHYALHCVVNHALVTKDEKLRKAFSETMAGQLENQKLHPTNRAYLCQELQWCGRDEACAALGKVLTDDILTDAATSALIAIGGERAASPLRAAAARAEGKARLNVIDALAVLADPKAAEIFDKALTDKDAEVRMAAAAGLARTAQADAAETLLKAAAAAQSWERTQLTKSCLVLAEKLAAAGKKPAAKQIYEKLKATRTSDAEEYLRDAADRGLKAIA